MDETLATQSDGTTQAKRPRVEVALAEEGSTPRLVNKANPLPVNITADNGVTRLLEQILEELRFIRLHLEE